MCLNTAAKKLVVAQNFVIGYKVLTLEGRRWKSYFANQFWDFAKLVEAKRPSYIGFTGDKTCLYRRGIHAYKKPNQARKDFIDVLKRGNFLLVKVLLFGVTHHDQRSYRADAAIIIETLDEKEKRIPWPGD